MPTPTLDFATTLARSVRTIFASIPYFVDEYTTQAVTGLQGVDSPLVELAIVPVRFIGDVLYAATNFVAQIVARLPGLPAPISSRCCRRNCRR